MVTDKAKGFDVAGKDCPQKRDHQVIVNRHPSILDLKVSNQKHSKSMEELAINPTMIAAGKYLGQGYERESEFRPPNIMEKAGL